MRGGGEFRSSSESRSVWLGFHIRRNLTDDSPAQGEEAPVTAPVREAFRTERRMIARLIGLGAVGAVGFYMCFVYVTTYLRQVDLIAQSKALDINTISMAVLLLLMAPVGALSDRVGRKPLLIFASVGMFIMAWPLFWMLHHSDFVVALLGQIGFAVLSGCFWGVIPATMVELVPYRLRCTVLSVGYNAGMAVLGGLTPMVAVYTIERSEYDLSPAFLLMAASAVSLLVVLGLRETSRLPLASPEPAIADAV